MDRALQWRSGVMVGRARNLPLSAVSTAGGIGLLTIAVLSAVTVQYLLHETTTRRLQLERGDLARQEAREGLLVGLLDQELARRAVVASGDPRFLQAYERGAREEAEAWARVAAAVGQDEASASHLARLRATVDAWHEQVVVPQLFHGQRAAAEPPARLLEEGQARFDEVRGAVASLEGLEASLGRDRTAALARHGQRVVLAASALFAVLLTAGSLLLVWGHRRVAVPLRLLAAQVEAGNTLDLPAATSPIREVSTLQAALVRLERRVSEREGVLRAEREDAEALGRFAEIVQQTAAEGELYQLLVRFLEAVVSPTAISVFSLNPSENHLALVHPARTTDEQFRLPIVTEPMSCRAIRSARDVFFGRRGDPGACECPLASVASHLCLPLMATGQVIGLVSLQAAEPAHWTARRVRLAQSLVATASTTLNSIRLLARSRDSAVRDALTHAYNRRFLVEVLPKLVHQGIRSRSPVSALMIDVDHFKDFNDHHGHDAGDRVLAAVARCLAEKIRMSDTLVRYGGEEFAVLLPNTSLTAALAMAERTREAVEAMRTAIPQSDRPLSVTVSIGVASVPEHGASGDDLLLAADKALFRAKEAGRNRVLPAVSACEPGSVLALAAG
jgi:diguanylate cyclase (GGDEF)-like protein